MYEYANGDIYIGDWVNGEKQGEGEYIYHNKKKFKGKFKNDEFYNGIY